MRYEQPELLDSLASAYVLGTLRGPARRRFERLCARNAAADVARRRWEDRLLPLALATPAVEPRADSWSAIQRQLAAHVQPAPASRARRWAAVAAVAIVALLVVRLAPWQQTHWQLVADLAPARAATQWRVERSVDGSQIVIRTMQAPTAAPATSFELWVLPKGQGNPVSLGLIPASGRIERQLTATQQQMLLAGANLAVSVEPTGGSPTGLPTGPVIIVAPIVSG